MNKVIRLTRGVTKSAPYPVEPTREEFPWAVENSVVKGPLIAIFRNEEEAQNYADTGIDLRVIRNDPSRA